MSGRAAGPDGLLVVDKATGLTSHDVVARLRRLAQTRKVGHAGTLDPDATGVLVCGVGRATRLLGHLLLAEKEYEATVRLGVTTTTDDAEGEILRTRSTAAVTDDAITDAVAALTGDIQQIPSSVSAIKVNGQRAYALVRKGEEVQLQARPVTVSRFDVIARRSADELDIAVTCSSGTYIRALARDLGEALGCGAHLTALRRTRVGPFTLKDAHTLEQLAEAAPDRIPLLTLNAAVGSLFPRRDASPEEAADLGHGRPLSPTGRPGAIGVFGLDGEVLALVEDKDGLARPLLVLKPA